MRLRDKGANVRAHVDEILRSGRTEGGQNICGNVAEEKEDETFDARSHKI